MAELQPSQTQDTQPSLFHRALKIAAYPVSLLVGSYYTYKYINDVSYEGLKKVGGKNGGVFHKEWDERAAKTTELLQQFESKAITGEAFAKGRHAADLAYSTASKITTHDVGYGSVFKRAAHLDSYSKLRLPFTFFTTAGVTLGVMLTIADSKRLTERFNNMTGRHNDSADIGK